MALLDESEALHARARAFVLAYERGETPPEEFDALGRDLVTFQARHNAGYARLCGAHPGPLPPAVPTDAFKVARVSVWAERETPTVFRTSGTTRASRGAHWFRTTATYDAGAVAFARRALDIQDRIPVFVIGPPPAAQPDSSLVHMIERLVLELSSAEEGEPTYFLEGGVLDIGALDERIAKLMVSGVRDVVLLGTSLAFVHLLDVLGEATFRLPDRARVMQTGGFKGAAKTPDAATLRRDIARAFCIEERAVVSEYGMTELSSQFWEMTMHAGAPNVYVEPPWARVIPVDAETLLPVTDGAAGLARIEDLLNVDSAFAIVTHDRVRRVGAGFELLGRAEGAEARGCSIATAEMLAP